jgi:hypothetical protein
MEDMQRRFRDELDAMKQRWGGALTLQRVTPKYSFAGLGSIQRLTRATGRNATRVEVLYEHLQEEFATLGSQAGEGEYPVALYGTGDGDVVQVGSIGYRNPDLLVIEGVDEANQRTRVLAQAGSAQFVLKLVKAAPDANKPATDFTFMGNVKPE